VKRLKAARDGQSPQSDGMHLGGLHAITGPKIVQTNVRTLHLFDHTYVIVR